MFGFFTGQSAAKVEESPTRVFEEDGEVADDTKTEKLPPPTVTEESVPETGDSPSKSLAVRIRPYTGVELKTLWNHFNKEDLITYSELGGLLERIIIKDSTDLFTDLKRTHGWKKYVQSAMKKMDTSKGSTIDLSEFNSEFNQFNTHRFYYLIKYLLPEVISLLKSYSQEMNLSVDKLGEFGRDPDASNPDDLKKIKQLESLLAEYRLKVESIKTDDNSEISARNKKWEDEVAQLRQTVEKNVSENTRLQAMRRELGDAARSAEAENEALRRELEKVRNEKPSIDIDQFVGEWTRKFKDVIDENTNLRDLVSNNKTKLERMTADYIQVAQKVSDLETELQTAKNVKPNTIYGAAITGTELDPFRRDILKKFSSLENTFSNSQISLSPTNRNNGPRRITLTEVEMLATSMGYTRGYAKKLFFALDTRNKGILTLEQFSRPLPVLNHELVLLTKETTMNSHPES
jgi:hypothetical protein